MNMDGQGPTPAETGVNNEAEARKSALRTVLRDPELIAKEGNLTGGTERVDVLQKLDEHLDEACNNAPETSRFALVNQGLDLIPSLPNGKDWDKPFIDAFLNKLGAKVVIDGQETPVTVDNILEIIKDQRIPKILDLNTDFSLTPTAVDNSTEYAPVLIAATKIEGIHVALETLTRGETTDKPEPRIIRPMLLVKAK
jgi:hypothetical protein